MCQLDNLGAMSIGLSYIHAILRRVRSRVNEMRMGFPRNIPKRIGKFAESIRLVPKRTSWSLQNDKKSCPFPESLNLRTGDKVRVRPRREIARCLDPQNSFRGLQFMRPMWKYCGREMTVFKRVRLVYDGGAKMKKCRNIVLLRGAVCDGRNVLHEEGCDRSCFLFWKEAWLEKVE